MLVLLLVACGGESETYRYRMTVYVDTPAGQRSGSSVIEVVSSTPVLMGSFQDDVRGEAVAVDLPGGTVFALLRSPTNVSAAGQYAFQAYAAALPRGSDWRTRIDTLKRQTAPARMSDNDLPMFVRFRDPADARTIEVVNTSYDFGPGVRLNHIDIQMTDDPVTETIEGRLPNFGAGSGYDAWSATLDFHDPRRLFTQDFRTGF